MTGYSVGMRPRTGTLIAICILASVLGFFLAPIIPVYIATPCVPGDPTFVPHTDWQSPGFHLLNLGFHTSAPYIYACSIV